MGMACAAGVEAQRDWQVAFEERVGRAGTAMLPSHTQ